MVGNAPTPFTLLGNAARLRMELFACPNGTFSQEICLQQIRHTSQDSWLSHRAAMRLFARPRLEVIECVRQTRRKNPSEGVVRIQGRSRCAKRAWNENERGIRRCSSRKTRPKWLGGADLQRDREPTTELSESHARLRSAATPGSVGYGRPEAVRRFRPVLARPRWNCRTFQAGMPPKRRASLAASRSRAAADSRSARPTILNLLRFVLRSGRRPRLQGWGGPPISGLPEIGTKRAQVG
jgi:hypothetical protein